MKRNEAAIAAAKHRTGRVRRERRWMPLIALMIGMFWSSEKAMASPLQIYAAGSLKAAMQALVAASGLPTGDVAEPVFGPAGLLRERLSKGEKADLFASADMAQPNRLAAADPTIRIVPFAHNRMCIASKPALGLTATNLLDRLLEPSVRLATSTPGVDPGGDYAMAVFDKADGVKPGAGTVLRSKALRLLGTPNAMVVMAGRSPAATIFLGDKADALLYYCSGIPALLKEVDGLVGLPLPDTLEVHPTYGLAILSDNPNAASFGLFMVSTKGQQILARFGFLPIARAQ